ncbi:MAG: hypothetical protein K2X47_04600, partial [Bdellovibrionales bacterium]|nr:hypothetical protein [Bdellovibrionales bacterium]
GADWCLKVAEEVDRAASNLPAVPQFLFPFAFQGSSAPKNAHFQPLSWESGLREEIERSAAVIIPSLWSACIEGSLVKSLGHGQLVFVVENSSSFSAEIPAPILLSLSENPKNAAAELLDSLSRNWPDLGNQRKAWFADFQIQKKRLWTTLTASSL